MRHRRMLVAALPLIAVLFTGCATSIPAAEPAAVPTTTTPTAEPAPEPAALVIGGRGITMVDDEGRVVSELSYTRPGAEAVDYLTAAFGAAPVISHRESDFNCVPAADVAVWDGYFTLNYNVDGWTPEGQASFAHVIAPASPNGLAFHTTSGFGVGDSVDALLASQAGVAEDSADFEGHAYSWVHYDVAEGVELPDSDPRFGQDPYWGALASGVDGLIVGLHAPVAYIDLC